MNLTEDQKFAIQRTTFEVLYFFRNKIDNKPSFYVSRREVVGEIHTRLRRNKNHFSLLCKRFPPFEFIYAVDKQIKNSMEVFMNDKKTDEQIITETLFFIESQFKNMKEKSKNILDETNKLIEEMKSIDSLLTQ